jgi:hypothetical protein
MVVSLVAALVIGACGVDEPVGDCPAGERIPARGGGVEQVIRTVGRLGDGPIAGVAVQVDDSEWKETDADGNATFDGVGSPFSVRVRQSVDKATDRVWQLVGQTANPLVVRVAGSGTNHTASIGGRVGGLSGGADSEVVVIGHSGGLSRTGIASPDGLYQVEPLRWNGPPTQTIELVALELQLPYPPMHFIGSGVATVEVNDADSQGAEVTGIDIELGPVAEAHVSGTVVVPASLDEVLYPLLALELEDGSVEDILYDYVTSSPGAFDLTIPLLDGVNAILGFEGWPYDSTSTGRVERRFAAAAIDVRLEVPSPVELLEPPQEARVDTRTRLRWRAEPDAAKYVVVMTCYEGTDDFTREIHFEWIETTENEVCLPLIDDLDPRGSCSWRVGWLDDGAAAYYQTGIRADEQRTAWSLWRSVTFR